MSDLERVQAWFSDGSLVRPNTADPDLVDLSRAILSLAGVDKLGLSQAAANMRDSIGAAEHYVFVLIDGLGTTFVDKCPEGGFLRGNQVGEIHSVCLATTSAALTTLATAEYPGRHGVLSWWVWLAEYGLSTTILPFVERFTGSDLVEMAVDPATVFTAPSVLSRAGYDPRVIVPEAFVDSVYTRYSAGSAERCGYDPAGMVAGFELAAEHVRTSSGPTYTYLYLPQVDGECHGAGVGSPKVPALLASMDAQLSRLRDDLPPSARIIVTGDHGHVDLAPENVRFIEHADPMMDALSCPPSGEATVPFFHVKEGREDEFRDRFRARFGEEFALLSADEIETLEFFGPAPLTAEARSRLGDYVGIAREVMGIYFRPEGAEVSPLKGVHGGMRPAEMIMPLIVA